MPEIDEPGNPMTPPLYRIEQRKAEGLRAAKARFEAARHAAYVQLERDEQAVRDAYAREIDAYLWDAAKWEREAA